MIKIKITNNYKLILRKKNKSKMKMKFKVFKI